MVRILKADCSIITANAPFPPLAFFCRILILRRVGWLCYRLGGVNPCQFYAGLRNSGGTSLLESPAPGPSIKYVTLQGGKGRPSVTWGEEGGPRQM